MQVEDVRHLILSDHVGLMIVCRPSQHSTCAQSGIVLTAHQNHCWKGSLVPRLPFQLSVGCSTGKRRLPFQLSIAFPVLEATESWKRSLKHLPSPPRPYFIVLSMISVEWVWPVPFERCRCLIPRTTCSFIVVLWMRLAIINCWKCHKIQPLQPVEVHVR